jgi:hypothetical protein
MLFTDVPRWAPEPGTVLTRTFESSQSLELEEAVLEYDGTPVDTGALGLAIELQFTRSLAVEDRIVAVADGKPKLLQRKFERVAARTLMSQHQMGDDQTFEFEGTSPLVDQQVAYEFDAEHDTWKKRQVEGTSLDAEVLEGLEEDIDLREWIAGDALSVGSKWKPPVSALRPLLFPAGRLSSHMQSENGAPVGGELLGVAQELLIDDLQGEVEADYEGIAEEDGRRYARIKLAFDVRAEQDLLPLASQLKRKIGDGSTPLTAYISCSDTFEWKGEGVVLWDLAAEHVHSARLEGPGKLVFKGDLVVVSDGRSTRVTEDFTFGGPIKTSLDVRH